MIVVITSWAPTVALRNPAMPAHSAPASIASAIASTMCTSGREARPGRADPDRDDRPDEVLPLAADVEEAAAERERDGEPRQDQRRRQEQRLLEVDRGERCVLDLSAERTSVEPRAKNQLRPGALEDPWYVLSGLFPSRARRGRR